jgi:hypothetical protein
MSKTKANRFPMGGQELDDIYEERAAIVEANSNVSLWEAENQAAQSLGFNNKSALKLEVQFRKSIEGGGNHDETCCWCNDEGSTDGSGEIHPCAFCGSY